jgi:TPR repeat protein
MIVASALLSELSYFDVLRSTPDSQLAPAERAELIASQQRDEKAFYIDWLSRATKVYQGNRPILPPHFVAQLADRLLHVERLDEAYQVAMQLTKDQPHYFQDNINHYLAVFEQALAMLYLNGEVRLQIAPDIAKGLRFAQLAAQHGAAQAQYQYGMLFLAGQHLERNTEQALRWLRAAADQEHTMAQIQLGDIYRDGALVAKDIGAARMWYLRAQRHGNPVGTERLRDLPAVVSQ